MERYTRPTTVLNKACRVFHSIVPVPISWFGYCTVVMQDATTGGSWQKATQDSILFLQLPVSLSLF